MKLLALLVGVSTVSFGASYQITSAWINADRYSSSRSPWFQRQAAAPQAMVPALSLEQPQLSLRRANFKLLTRAAYSLLDRTSDQSASANSSGSGDAKTDFAALNLGKS